MLNFNNNADVAQMHELQRIIVNALLPYTNGERRAEAGLAVFALVRCARVLLRKYPKVAQEELLDAIVPFLEGKAEPRQRERGRRFKTTDSGLIITDGLTH